MITISIRLEEAQDKELEAIARKLKLDKSSVARRIIDEGLKIVRRQEAIDNVRTRRWTVWKAAEHCGESYRSFLEIMRQENIPFPISVEELEHELHENRG